MTPQPDIVKVIAPARLHMGFIDLSGALGRHFGSIGLALNEIGTEVSITAADSCHVIGESQQRAEKCVQTLCEQLGVSSRIRVAVEQAIPEHIGLGSGTQMALAIGMALNRFYGLNKTIREIAQLTERGMRSGIGIGVFEQGGLVVDGGRGKDTLTPPVISQMHVPESWRFILVFDNRGQGLHGDKEIMAFKELPPFPEHEAARLCYLLLMQGLPALAEQDLGQFGGFITQLQQSVGEHFAPAQGDVFTSEAVADVMAFFRQQSAVAIGQTSWGPTGFCAVASQTQAQALVDQAQQQFKHLKTLRYQITSARNRGGEIICI